jgi:hypothetical protein
MLCCDANGEGKTKGRGETSSVTETLGSVVAPLGEHLSISNEWMFGLKGEL